MENNEKIKWMKKIIKRAKNETRYFNKLDEKMYLSLLRLQCSWCASIATKNVDSGFREEIFCCDKCAKNIESFKARFCRNKDVYCCPPIVRDMEQLSDFPRPRLWDYENNKEKKRSWICNTYNTTVCNICRKYVIALLRGHETDFFKIDFYETNEFYDNDSDSDSGSDHSDSYDSDIDYKIGIDDSDLEYNYIYSD